MKLLDLKCGDIVLDGTVGLGGHATSILPHIMPGGRYIGLDIDPEMVALATERLSAIAPEGVQVVHANYAEFPQVLGALRLQRVDKLLVDLGVNSAQLSNASRGFSFEREGPLDMRFDQTQETQALDLVNSLDENGLADIFYHYGQERLSRKIARRICQVRRNGRIRSTGVLARAVEAAVIAAGQKRGKVHPATRVFQSLRIAVNRELENLEAFLGHVVKYLAPGGRLAVISFHSLEDGLVKRFLRGAKQELDELTDRPVVAEPQERDTNPRSRSAKLRVAARRLEN